MADRALSDFEISYIKKGVLADIRSDGRSCRDYRNFELRSGIVSNTSGSAEIKLERTNILVGVKAEIGQPNPSHPKKGRIEFFVDCSALASPKFQGREGETLGHHLAHRLSDLYNNSNCIDLESLSIIPGQFCWIIYVDALVLLMNCNEHKLNAFINGNLTLQVLEWSGGVLDCLSIAIRAALANTKIPKLTVIGEGEEQEIEISDNPFDSTSIDTENVPVFVSLSLIGDQFIVDASHEEEACSLCQLSVGINHKGSICGILKEGTGSFKYKQYNDAISLASEIGVSVIEKITVTNSTAPEMML